MRRFWTTAAAAALCVFAADAWAAPYGGRLELVATHHAKTAETTDKASKRRGKTATTKAKGKSANSASESHSRRTRHGLRIEKTEEAPAHGRKSRHAAAEETSRTRGRHGRHETAAVESRARHGRHRGEAVVAEAPRRGRHGRTAPSEIRVEGGSVKVGRHDTLESISRETGLSVSALARLNHLKKPYHVKRGEVLKLPERRYYVVRSGDTLYSVGRKFGLEASDLTAFNSLEGRHIRSGQKLYLPNDAHETLAPIEEEAPAPARRPAGRPVLVPTLPLPAERPYARPAPSYTPPPAQSSAPPASSSQDFELTPSRPQAYQPVAPPAAGRPIIQSSPAPSASDVATAGRGKFIWPASGPVIQGFGPKADGQRNDGLNITASTGDAVRAAADGEVVYAGDQVPSYGNLVLIKHPGGWVTAYAHMSRILVKNRDQVVQGQQIGAVGQSGSVDRPQLHFEIRYAPSPKDKATPVDPALVLPER